MNGPVLNVSVDKIMEIVSKLLSVFKKIMAWLGILILPEEGEYDYPDSTTKSAEELAEEGAL